MECLKRLALRTHMTSLAPVRKILISCFAFVFVLLNTGITQAHVVELIYLKFEATDDHSWKATVYFDAGYALPEMRADAEAPQPKREWLTSQSEANWKKLREGAAAYLQECLGFTETHHDGQVVTATQTITFPDFNTSPPDFPQLLDGCAYMRICISGTLKQGALTLRVNDGDRPSFTVAQDDTVVAVAPGDSIKLMERNSHTGQSTLSHTSWLHRAKGFLWLGFEHVLPSGLDHVLFILALFLYTPKWRPLLHQSLMFTVAHSLTLGLMLGGVVNIPASYIEPIIALSIAWVAFEHVFFPDKLGKFRLSMVFAFGLIHGLGFASALRHGLIMHDGWLMPLIMANIGIELAQISILGACLLVFHRFTDSTWFTKTRLVTAVCIGLTGLWWCISRTLGAL